MVISRGSKSKGTGTWPGWTHGGDVAVRLFTGVAIGCGAVW